MNENEIKILNDMINSDKSVEEITKYINELRGKKKNQEKENYLKQMETVFNQHHKEKKLVPRDAAILSLLVVKDSYPKWTVADMKEYVDAVEEVIKVLPKISCSKLKVAEFDPIKASKVLKNLMENFF